MPDEPTDTSKGHTDDVKAADTTPPDQLLTGTEPEPEGDDTKPADTKADDATDDKDGKTPPAEGDTDEAPDAAHDGEPTAPETYALKLPEGFDTDQQTRFEEIARKAGLTNAQAQKLVDALPPPDAQVTALSDSLRTEMESNKEAGGTREEVDKTVALVKSAVERFLPEPDIQERLATDMTAAGLENYLPLVLLMSRVGKAMAEDTLIAAKGSTPPDTRTTAEIMYDHPDNKLVGAGES